MRRLLVFLLPLLFAAVAATPTPASAQAPACAGLVATISGLAGTIVGTNGPDVIVGSDGDDVIDGRGGDDVICGGAGFDTITGGAGSDRLSGEVTFDVEGCELAIQADELIGGSGDDVIVDLCGDNLADGGQGRDAIRVTGTAQAGSGDDLEVTALGGDVNDQCPGCWEGHALGGSGSDEVVVVDGVADGGSGNDRVLAKADGDEARGGSGNDQVAGSLVATLDGGSGADTCEQGATPDSLISCEVVL